MARERSGPLGFSRVRASRRGSSALEATVAVVLVALAGSGAFSLLGGSFGDAVAGGADGGAAARPAHPAAPAAQAGLASGLAHAAAERLARVGAHVADHLPHGAHAADETAAALDGLPFTVGVDVDQVLALHDHAFRDLVAHVLRRPKRELPIDHYSWDFSEWGLAGANRSEFERIRALGVTHHDYLARLRPMPGGATALGLLRDAGARVHIITHRLFGDHFDHLVRAQTHDWFSVNHIPFDALSFEGVKTRIPAHRYVDDSPRNIAAFEAAGRKAVMFEAPYNREVPLGSPHTVRAKNWAEAADTVAGDMVEHGLILPRERSELVREVKARVERGLP